MATSKLFLFIGAINAFLSVALGAFGAHGLRAKLPPDLLAVYKTGVEYHFYHALGLLAVGLVAANFPSSSLVRVSGWAMAAGIVVFSGSLYLLAITGTRWLGAVTPIGGVAFLVGWALLAYGVLKA